MLLGRSARSNETSLSAHACTLQQTRTHTHTRMHSPDPHRELEVAGREMSGRVRALDAAEAQAMKVHFLCLVP
jgi:hypothetical protein